MAQLPTVEDVAARAGVSRQTVSNVLNSPRDRAPGDPRAGRDRDRRARLPPARHAPGDCARAERRRSASGWTRSPTGSPARILDRFLHAAHRAGRRARHAHHALHRRRPRRRDPPVPARCATAPTSTRSCSPRPTTTTRASSLARRAAASRSSRSGARGAPDDRRPGAPLGRRRRRRGRARGHRAPHRPRATAASATSAGRPAPGPATTAASGWERAMTATLRRGVPPMLVTEAEEGVPTRARRGRGLLRGGTEPRGARLRIRLARPRRHDGGPRGRAARTSRSIGFDNTPVAKAVGLSSVDQRARRRSPRAPSNCSWARPVARAPRTATRTPQRSAPPPHHPPACRAPVESPGARRGSRRHQARRSQSRGMQMTQEDLGGVPRCSRRPASHSPAAPVGGGGGRVAPTT